MTTTKEPKLSQFFVTIEGEAIIDGDIADAGDFNAVLNSNQFKKIVLACGANDFDIDAVQNRVTEIAVTVHCFETLDALTLEDAIHSVATRQVERRLRKAGFSVERISAFKND